VVLRSAHGRQCSALDPAFFDGLPLVTALASDTALVCSLNSREFIAFCAHESG
jgi:hypothetical protein